MAQLTVLHRAGGEPRTGWAAIGGLGLLAACALPAVVVFLAAVGWDLLASGRAGSLLGAEWFPTHGAFGLAPLVAGTLCTSVLALAVTVPVGLGAIIYLHFFAGRRVQRLGDATLGVLGGTPSVVFGLFGTVWLVPLVGPSLLAAVLVLSVMVLPTFALLGLAALRQVPPTLLSAGAALGLRREQVIARLALRVARPHLAAAATVALARCLGEALAVEMVCGNVAALPSGLTAPVRTLTTTLVQEFDYARAEHNQALHLVALTVVSLAAIASLAAVRWQARRMS